MRRLTFILVLAILVGGVPLWNAQASVTPQMVHSSVLLAQAAVQPSSGFWSGFAAAIDQIMSSVVDSVVDAVKSVFGARVPAKDETPVTLPESLPKTDAKPTTEAVSLFASTPVVAPAKGATPQPPSTTMQSQPTSAPKSPSEAEPETGKVNSSLFGKNTAQQQPVAPTVAKPSARDTLGFSKVKTTPKLDAASKAATSAAQVSATPAQSATTTPTTSSASTSPQYAPPVQATIAPSAPAARPEATAASQPLMYSQPFVDVPARPTVPTGPAVVRETPTRPTALVPTRPVVTATREPIVALPRFIDAFTAPSSRVTIAEQTSTTATRETAAQPTSPVDSRASILDATETRSAVTPPSDTTATIEPPAELSYRTNIIKNETQLVVIQVGPSTTTIVDPATTEAVVCSNEPILSLGDDDTGVTRGIVMNDGTIFANPTSTLTKYVRLEGAPFAIDAVATECTLTAALNRLSAPESIINMPRGLSHFKTAVAVNGFAFTVATDADNILRAIVLRSADGQSFIKMLPERNQVAAQTITTMTVRGSYPGTVAVIMDGTTCEFSATTDMTCTAR